MTDAQDRLDHTYREAGWGRVTDEALGIRPSDVESQARIVAEWASTRIAELEAQLADKETEISALRHGVDRLQTKAMVAVDRARDLEIESRFRTGAVKVKTLEWTRGWMNAEAHSEIGLYTISYRRDGSFDWGVNNFKGWASSWDAAKAAAQADYERRVLSALAEPAASEVLTRPSMEWTGEGRYGFSPASPEGQQPVAYIYDIAHLYDKKTNKYSGWRTRVSITKPCAGLGQRNARPSEPTVTEAGKALIRIVEGVEGAVKHGTWRDTSGKRLKDTPEWAAFYVAIRSLPEDPQPVAWQRRCLYPSAPGSIPQWNQCCASEATNQFERKPDYEYRPLYHHTSGSSVPAAKLAQHLADVIHIADSGVYRDKAGARPSVHPDFDKAVNALKAAMETKP